MGDIEFPETIVGETEKMDNLSKAFALARLGIKVFPVASATRRPMIPEQKGGRGFYDATSDDFEKIATWFTVDYPESMTSVGVWTGGSGLIAADLDRGKKNGKDGFESLKKSGRSVTATEHYGTASGGEHHIYQSTRLDLMPGVDSLGMDGVDIRAGGSYVVWWGDSVPDSREAFSADIPDWIIEAATVAEATFTGEGFSGTVKDWLEAIPDDDLPSGRIRDLMARIPAGQFGHPEMIDLAWAIVRMGSERETGIKMALDALQKAWLRKPFNTAANRRDFDNAIKGGINKGGRVQNSAPVKMTLRLAMNQADGAGVGDQLKALERKVSETSTEIDFARARREMFKVAAEADMTPGAALGIVLGSKAFKHSKASLESVWFGDGEPEFHDKIVVTEESIADELTEEEAKIEREVELTKRVATLAADAAAFSFLSPEEQAIANSYDWWGKDYLAFVMARLKHFNKPYHVSAMWAALSTIASPWGKVKSQGGKPIGCNLYISAIGESTSGKSESLGFGTDMIDAYYGLEGGPIIGDISKLSALALHRQLIVRDGKPSVVFGDEIQSFFQGVQNTQWQNGILGDLSSHYGGEVSPKLTLNDREISGKRAKTLLTTYLTGIADQLLDSMSINHWTNGFFYRFLWSFGEPRQANDHEINFTTSATPDYASQFEKWAREFRRVAAVQEMKWGLGREVEWEEDARKRMGKFSKQIEDVVKTSPLFDSVFVSSNVRFLTSIMKCATLVAVSQASDTVTLNHVLVALDYAGPWHRSMMLAVSETGKEPFEREVEKALIWIKRSATRQVGSLPVIQRSAVMRQFKPNEIADRLLRQLTEEGWLLKSGDTYQLLEG